eukprot:284552-Lingulodinium_polyedra.AAC.1
MGFARVLPSASPAQRSCSFCFALPARADGAAPRGGVRPGRVAATHTAGGARREEGVAGP